MVVEPRLCQVVDVFADQVFVAPVAHKRRMQDIALDEFALGKVAGMRAGTIDRNGEVQPDQTPTVLRHDAGHSAAAAARVQNGIPVE